METAQTVKGHYLYNMLQDFRHLLVIDLRSPQEWEANHIRDSFNFDQDSGKGELIKTVQNSLVKAKEKEEKYKQLKKVRRYFFIGAQGRANILETAIKLLPNDTNNKLYSLSEQYNEFYETYPYVCLNLSQLVSLKEKNAPEVQINKWQLYPFCRFPSQIIVGKLYLGGLFGSNSEKILGDMKIKGLVDFIDYEIKNDDEAERKQAERLGQQVPDFKKDQQKYSYLHLPFNKDVPVGIDFDEINKEIDSRIEHGRVLLYCNDGETISPNFAIAYLMYKAKLDVQMATLKVCQAISRTDFNKWIYSQLLTYKPK